MFKMAPQILSELYGKDLIAFGTGDIGRRIIPYLAQDPDIKLHGVTSSRITVNDSGTFLDTGLPVRSLAAWAELLPDAVIILTLSNVDAAIPICKSAGFQKFQFVTPELLSSLEKSEGQIAEAHAREFFEYLCMANELHDIHKAAFSEFRECNWGKTVAVVGTGPSLSYYTQLQGVSHIGVNASFLKKDLSLDYYFITHYISEWCERLKEYSFVKFFDMNRQKDQFPEYIINENNGRRFFSMSHIPSKQLHTNIECYPLMGYLSIIFRAIHFALYTHPQKLLLIGCDCSADGHFDGVPLPDTVHLQIPHWVEGYKTIKEFAAIHYPDTEIISVNPVGLKGMFRDAYTQSYLDAHPEIDRDGCEITRLEDLALKE